MQFYSAFSSSLSALEHHHHGFSLGQISFYRNPFPSLFRAFFVCTLAPFHRPLPPSATPSIHLFITFVVTCHIVSRMPLIIPSLTYCFWYTVHLRLCKLFSMMLSNACDPDYLWYSQYLSQIKQEPPILWCLFFCLGGVCNARERIVTKWQQDINERGSFTPCISTTTTATFCLKAWWFHA